MDPDVPTEEKHARAVSWVQPPELEDKGSALHLTLAVSKGEAKSEGKTETGAHTFSWVDAEMAIGPAERGAGANPWPGAHLSCSIAVVS